MTAPEFSRRIPLVRIGMKPSSHAIAANPDERAALATRFALAAIDRLEADITLHRDGDAVVAQGRVRGEVVQTCIASGEPVAATIDEPIVIRFVPERTPSDDEVELDADDCDEMLHDGLAADIGEAAAQTLLLALDPYPRSPAAAEALKAAGVVSDDEARTGPFATLGALITKKEQEQP